MHSPQSEGIKGTRPIEIIKEIVQTKCVGGKNFQSRSPKKIQSKTIDENTMGEGVKKKVNEKNVNHYIQEPSLIVRISSCYPS